jgi:site-specific DNA-methyltransferase (adenine-specific)
MLELNKIYLNNCIDEMKKLPEQCIDLIVTDPPYKVVSRGSVGKNVKARPKGVLERNDGKLFNHTNIKISDWMPEIYRLLKQDSHCYIFTNSLNLKEMLIESEKAKFKLHNILVWEKNNCTPSQFYMKNCEYVLFLRKGKAKWINDIGGSKTVHKFNNIIGNKIHPTEKPIDLLEFYIANSSNENDIVLDPFMGSGATAIASINLKRKYIGFEIDEEYYKIAEERIHNRF